MTFYLVFSGRQLEGSFTALADAQGYVRELLEIGIGHLTICVHEVQIREVNAQ